MEEKKEGACGATCGSGCMGHYKHHFLKKILVLIVVILAFVLGMQIGELKGELHGEHGFGGHSMMMHGGYNYMYMPMMGGGFGGQTSKNWTSPAVPASPTTGTSTK